MDALRSCICEWFAAGRRVAVATIVRVIGSAPFAPGAMMAVNDDGDLFGTISNGCVESAIAELAREVFRTGRALERTFDSDEDDVAGISLLCGGRIDVRIEEISDDAVPRIFARTAPAAHLFVAGANDYARALAEIARLAEYRVTIVDPRPAFAVASRFAGAQVFCEWPDAYAARTEFDSCDAVVLLSHDTRYDVPLLQHALASRAFYIGAMGSRRTQQRRLERLVAAGVSSDRLARLRAPVGLDLGGRTAHETAIAILAEIIAVRNGRAAVPLQHEEGPIHDPHPDTATAALLE